MASRIGAHAVAIGFDPGRGSADTRPVADGTAVVAVKQDLYGVMPDLDDLARPEIVRARGNAREQRVFSQPQHVLGVVAGRQHLGHLAALQPDHAGRTSVACALLYPEEIGRAS